jgi:hypothetical protein
VRRLAFQPFQKSKCALECQSTWNAESEGNGSCLV